MSKKLLNKQITIKQSKIHELNPSLTHLPNLVSSIDCPNLRLVCDCENGFLTTHHIN